MDVVADDESRWCFTRFDGVIIMAEYSKKNSIGGLLWAEKCEMFTSHLSRGHRRHVRIVQFYNHSLNEFFN